jgi:hypothetical protein
MTPIAEARMKVAEAAAILQASTPRGLRAYQLARYAVILHTARDLVDALEEFAD